MASSAGSGHTTPVIVVTGTSGAGKGSIERILISRMPELELAVSAVPDDRGRFGPYGGRFVRTIRMPWQTLLMDASHRLDERSMA